MKKLLVLLLSLIFMPTAHAEDLAKLRMHITGYITDNRYFLCVSNVGCVSILSGDKGKTFPLESGNIAHVFAVNATKMHILPQQLPSSCNINVNENQTLTVSGKLIEKANGVVELENLNCTVN